MRYAMRSCRRAIVSTDDAWRRSVPRSAKAWSLASSDAWMASCCSMRFVSLQRISLYGSTDVLVPWRVPVYVQGNVVFKTLTFHVEVMEGLRRLGGLFRHVLLDHVGMQCAPLRRQFVPQIYQMSSDTPATRGGGRALRVVHVSCCAGAFK